MYVAVYASPYNLLLLFFDFFVPIKILYIPPMTL